MFVGLTYAGEYGAIWLALAVAAAVAWRRPWLVPAVLAAVVAADLTSSALKAAVDRDRPKSPGGVDTLVSTPTSGSFPSGHAATSFAAAIVLAFAFPRLAPLFLTLAAAIAFSRLYVGVHYPLDVLAGAALGAAIATALLLLGRALRGSRPPRTPVPPTGPRPGCSSPRTRPESR